MNILKSLGVILLFLLGCSGGGGGGGTDSTPLAETYSLTGKILLKNGMTVDGDTNDPNNVIISNNGTTIADTQPLTNDSTVGGFLGKIETTVDIDDYYKINLLKGQTVTLILSNALKHDFDLYLYDVNGSHVGDSQGTGSFEQVIVPESGTYYVDAYGYSVDKEGDEGGNYNIIIGQTALDSSSIKSQLSSTFPMVENEVLLRYVNDEYTATTANVQLSTLLAKSSIAIKSIDYSVTGIVRIKLEPSTALAGTTQTAFTRTVSKTIQAVKALRKSPDIAYAEPNYIVKGQLIPNDLLYVAQWHYPLISLPNAWNITTGSSEVIVAVIDCGVVLAHPDLSGQLVAGYDFISDVDNSNDGDGIDSDPNDPGSVPLNVFHGTHVAGTVAAASNNGIGVAGVAWKSKIMPIRVLGAEFGSCYDIAQGIYYAAGLANDSLSVPAKKASIINLSLGGLGYSETEYYAIAGARSANVIVVVAAGNDNVDSSTYSPAGFDNVITVSAVDLAAKKAPYSNWGAPIDVAAPGGDSSADLDISGFPDEVLSLSGVDDYGTAYYIGLQGTSMASPHIAGVIALMKAVNPNITQADFAKLLAGTHPETSRRITDDKGTQGWDIYYGYGLINAYSAVLAAGEITGGTLGPVLSVTPVSLNFDATTTTATLTLSNTGSDTLIVSSVTTNRSWLSVTPTQGGAGIYTVSADISQLAAGTYDGLITIVSNGGTKTVPVSLLIVASPVLSVTPVSLNFDATTTTATLTLSNTGSDTLIVSSVTTNRSWLSVTPTQGGAGIYTVSADISQLAAGTYDGLITIVSNGGTKTVPVSLLIVATPADSDIGTVYVKLLNPKTNAVVACTTTSKADDYNYIINNIPEGSYTLVAGTDMNGNDTISDSGEAYGVYPSTLAPSEITVNKDLFGKDFSLTYLIPSTVNE